MPEAKTEFVLSPTEEKFILHWGEMGNKWGINRTVAQIHSLLYIAPRPLNAEEIAGILKIARSNVSTSIKELLGWGIIRPVHVFGDRREHYESIHDVWELFWVVAEERKRRELDPTLQVLRECVAEMKSGEKTGKAAEQQALTLERLSALLSFSETMVGIYEQVKKVPSGSLLDKALKVFGKQGK